MKIVKEDLWLPADMHIVTTNSTLRGNGALVMGVGAALEAKNRFPGIDLECGQVIADHCARNVVYGFLLVRPDFGIFQVKKYWGDYAALSLIKTSVEGLKKFAEKFDGEIRMNFPGIGAGHLKYEDVLPLLEISPDNVTVCLK